jgi:hypothetical protein
MGNAKQMTRKRYGLGLACALVVLDSLSSAAYAQADVKPSTPAAGAAPTVSVVPRSRIELSPAERQALESTSAPTPTGSAPTRDELLPTADDARALQPAEERHTVIEQVRLPNRTTEIRVTPALTGRTYTMTTREGRQPLSATGTSPGLSVPNFFTFEFGGSEERPASTLPPPPPSSSTPR